jgi:hypothetical protein
MMYSVQCKFFPVVQLEVTCCIKTFPHVLILMIFYVRTKYLYLFILTYCITMFKLSKLYFETPIFSIAIGIDWCRNIRPCLHGVCRCYTSVRKQSWILPSCCHWPNPPLPSLPSLAAVTWSTQSHDQLCHVIHWQSNYRQHGPIGVSRDTGGHLQYNYNYAANNNGPTMACIFICRGRGCYPGIIMIVFVAACGWGVGNARVQILGEICGCWMASEGGISMIASSMLRIKPPM